MLGRLDLIDCEQRAVPLKRETGRDGRREDDLHNRPHSYRRARPIGVIANHETSSR